jgi:hypothetical protein
MDELLDKKLTYHEFCDLMSDAWLEAEQATNTYPDRRFRLDIFTRFEKKVLAAPHPEGEAS